MGKIESVDVMPRVTVDLIDWLEKIIPAPVLDNVGCLADDKHRLLMAYEMGRRDVVNMLRRRWDKESQQ
ncbi:MAG: hypothetical protein WC683_06975 [bacterium]